MARFIAAIAVLWGIVLISEPVLAACSYETTYLPDGRVMICQVCCNQYTGCTRMCN